LLVPEHVSDRGNGGSYTD